MNDAIKNVDDRISEFKKTEAWATRFDDIDNYEPNDDDGEEEHEDDEEEWVDDEEYEGKNGHIKKKIEKEYFQI